MLRPHRSRARRRPRSAIKPGSFSMTPAPQTTRLGHQSISKGITRCPHSSAYHAPPADRAQFDGTEEQRLDQETDHDDRHQAGEDVRRLEGRTVLVDVPADAAAARRDAEHKL